VSILRTASNQFQADIFVSVLVASCMDKSSQSENFQYEKYSEFGVIQIRSVLGAQIYTCFWRKWFVSYSEYKMVCELFARMNRFLFWSVLVSAQKWALRPIRWAEHSHSGPYCHQILLIQHNLLHRTKSGVVHFGSYSGLANLHYVSDRDSNPSRPPIRRCC
jgi:hypothetical protein